MLLNDRLQEHRVVPHDYTFCVHNGALPANAPQQLHLAPQHPRNQNVGPGVTKRKFAAVPAQPGV